MTVSKEKQQQQEQQDRPKERPALRSYDEHNEQDAWQQVVYHNYLAMHTHQTVQFVTDQLAKYSAFDHGEMSIMDAMEHLHTFVDQSDPDVDVPNVVHAYQTAEKIRRDHPDDEWFIFTGFIHDLGKVLSVWGEPQWAIGGDTFVVGCRPVDSVVYGVKSFQHNPDLQEERYNTEYGMYAPHCGLDNVLMSFGHDHYLYMVLKNHAQCKIPEEGLYMISGNDYKHLSNEHDEHMLKHIHMLNQYDLYSKTEATPDIDKLKPYYAQLADKFCPGKIRF